MRLKRPTRVSIEQVRITREGNDAIDDHADAGSSGAHLAIGPEIAAMTNAKIVDLYNDILESQDRHPGELYPRVDFIVTSMARYLTRYLNVPPAQRGWRTTRRLADRPRGTALRLGRSVTHAGRSVEASCNRSRSYSLRLVLADFRCAAPTTPRSLNDTTVPGARLLAPIRRRPVPVNT
jgi:hypothetical protein